ncbi:hypothetical protein SSAG_04415 [Streptomyces sp. Mg1]|nr:hypothetical protein SSAG_04415 [Streptomyces sp. Mg1]
MTTPEPARWVRTLFGDSWSTWTAPSTRSCADRAAGVPHLIAGLQPTITSLRVALPSRDLRTVRRTPYTFRTRRHTAVLFRFF